ncbi:hypothetical protein M9458_032897, partial [Cirrhinus mrigala]
NLFGGSRDSSVPVGDRRVTGVFLFDGGQGATAAPAFLLALFLRALLIDVTEIRHIKRGHGSS